jgi:hypothetical protein
VVSEAVNARFSATALLRANYVAAVASRVDTFWLPDHLNDQAAQWRDHGARYIVLCNASSLQPSLGKGLASGGPFCRILRGVKKL